jgi:DNA-binding NtrC family response regulator
MSGKQRILVVDDEHDITFVLEMMLNDRYDVDAYTDPVEARLPTSSRTSTT